MNGDRANQGASSGTDEPGGSVAELDDPTTVDDDRSASPPHPMPVPDQDRESGLETAASGRTDESGPSDQIDGSEVSGSTAIADSAIASELAAVTDETVVTEDAAGPDPEPVPAEAPPVEAVPADPLLEAVDELSMEHGLVAVIEDRTIMLSEPVTGSLHLAVLQALGYASAAAPVGAASHGPAGVAAAVWLAPQLYIVRWTGVSRWVSSYKFPNRARPDTYNRDDTGIPSHLAKDNWYDEVPDEVAEAFLSVGLLLDEPPFPVPAPPPPKPKAEAPVKARRASSTTPREPRARAPRKPAAPAVARPVAPASRTCAMCNLQKHPSQFVEGSDFCVDCR